MNDREIGDLLRALPHATASHRFRSDVLERAGEARGALAVWRYAAAFALTLSLAIVGVRGMQERADRQRMRDLRAEHARLETELREMKDGMAAGTEQVVVLENDDARFIVGVADQPAKAADHTVY